MRWIFGMGCECPDAPSRSNLAVVVVSSQIRMQRTFYFALIWWEWRKQKDRRAAACNLGSDLSWSLSRDHYSTISRYAVIAPMNPIHSHGWLQRMLKKTCGQLGKEFHTFPIHIYNSNVLFSNSPHGSSCAYDLLSLRRCTFRFLYMSSSQNPHWLLCECMTSI